MRPGPLQPWRQEHFKKRLVFCEESFAVLNQRLEISVDTCASEKKFRGRSSVAAHLEWLMVRKSFRLRNSDECHSNGLQSLLGAWLFNAAIF